MIEHVITNHVQHRKTSIDSRCIDGQAMIPGSKTNQTKRFILQAEAI